VRPRLAQLHQSGATDGQIAAWSAALQMWVPVDGGSVTEPLFADDGSGPLLVEGGTGYLYPNT
jgi:hypothetical protein